MQHMLHELLWLLHMRLLSLHIGYIMLLWTIFSHEGDSEDEEK